MAKDRKGVIGGELAALALIVACLVGALASIVATYRRVNLAAKVPVRVTPAATVPAPSPILVRPPSPVVAAPPPRSKRPQPAAAAAIAPIPKPEDPTTPVLARLTAAEADQLLAASQSDRRAQAFNDARRAAEAESERMRRRKSLIHAQIDAIEGRVRTAERELDALALERDALEKELDARKAAVAHARSRPGRAILPHKGPNGTWRRPIVVECRNGGAVIQPRGIEFGLLDLEADLFGMANPFVSAMAREASRVQGSATPDGAPAVPYVFFLVRPDGIRPYYEARSRLESLGVTFGYELADQDWVVDVPDLDDVTAWDGSAPASTDRSSLARTAPGEVSAEDDDLPTWPRARANGPDPADPFTFGGPGRGLAGGSAFSRLSGAGRNPRSGGAGPGGAPTGTDPDAPPPGPPAGPLPGATARGHGAATSPGPALGTGEGRASASTLARTADRMPAQVQPGKLAEGWEPLRAPLAADVGATRPAGPRGTAPGSTGSTSPAQTPTQGDGPGASGPPSLDPPAGAASGVELALDGPTADRATHSDPSTPKGESFDPTDPASGFVFRGKPSRGPGRDRPSGDPAESSVAPPGGGIDDASPTVGESGGDPTDPGQSNPVEASGALVAEGKPDGDPGARAAHQQLEAASPGGDPSSQPAQGGPPPPPGVPGLPGRTLANATPPSRPLPSPSSMPDLSKLDLSKLDPSKLPDLDKLPPIPPVPLPMNLPIPRHLPTPREAGAAVERQSRPEAPAPPPRPAPARRSFEIVVVCAADGVIVQPGNYRITPDALKDQEGLFKRQIVGLVKARRAADPATPVAPSVRFLVQPRGVETYRAARSQYFVSGLDWPTTTQIADPDPLVIRTRGVW